ncbi:protein of unknown function [Taphrina deformans PYCC 5710]|uniref:Uncharacterized protein n=1 Tax=Taphrina deformans (strain PYCC 5710 / ATCC 11124 / CBS 356.35 / IMI 108563 / JCM 9778 / NBRC 8474) TaxID=1097556 RepID=R4X7V0_TAPDE|nr:protein of unknown function [Taphrina deformans PYCC 5710]|eukprot:CCG81286.1 protein of unknown function [Taphrina deformans PYCC 5710]
MFWAASFSVGSEETEVVADDLVAVLMLVDTFEVEDELGLLVEVADLEVDIEVVVDVILEVGIADEVEATFEVVAIADVEDVVEDEEYGEVEDLEDVVIWEDRIVALLLVLELLIADDVEVEVDLGGATYTGLTPGAFMADVEIAVTVEELLMLDVVVVGLADVEEALAEEELCEVEIAFIGAGT